MPQYAVSVGVKYFFKTVMEYANLSHPFEKKQDI